MGGDVETKSDTGNYLKNNVSGIPTAIGLVYTAHYERSELKYWHDKVLSFTTERTSSDTEEGADADIINGQESGEDDNTPEKLALKSAG